VLEAGSQGCLLLGLCLKKSVKYKYLCVLLPSSSEGSNLTPAHHYNDFRFKTYAPVAFRYFRELFGIRPDDYLVSWWPDQVPFAACSVRWVFVPFPLSLWSAVRRRGKLSQRSSGCCMRLWRCLCQRLKGRTFALKFPVDTSLTSAFLTLSSSVLALQ